MNAAVPPSSAAVNRERIGDETNRRVLDLAREQQRRINVGVLLVDLFVVWLMSGLGMLVPAVIWAVCNAVGRGFRRHVVERERVDLADRKNGVRWFIFVLGLQGWLRACIVPFLFSVPLAPVHYVFSMLIVGQVAGGIGSMGGSRQGFIVWAAPVIGVLALAWIAQGTFETVTLGALMIFMFVILVRFATGYADAMEQVIESAEAQRQLATSLLYERDRAEQASQAKTRFFAAANHDLRQPLHALSIHATTLELLARRSSDAPILTLSQNILHAVEQSSSLLQSLLDLSRLDSGAIRIEPTAFMVTELLRSAVRSFQAPASDKGVQLDLQVANGADALQVNTDFETLLRIVNNLISNAVKFTPSGGRVRVSAREARGDQGVDEIAVTVADDGIGIAPEDHERVFEEFYQVGNLSRNRAEGLGLGLAIVRRSVLLLGGRMTLESAPGKGTSITVFLRAAAPSPGGRAPHVQQSNELEKAAQALRGLRVLVVDDEADAVRSVSMLLENCGCVVAAAASSAEAMEFLAAGFAPQMLIVDNRLRGEQGTALVATIRVAHPEVPALVVTGDTSPDHLRQLSNCGCPVLHKPVSGLLLLGAMTGLLARPSEPMRATSSS